MVRDRDHLIDRLQHLRVIVPVFAQELASAGRQAAQLRLENGRLLEEGASASVPKQRQSSAKEGTRAGKPAAAVKHDATIGTPRHAPLERVAQAPVEPATGAVSSVISMWLLSR